MTLNKSSACKIREGFQTGIFHYLYKNNTLSLFFLCVAAAAVGHLPDGGIKIAIKKDYYAIRDDLISVVARVCSRIYVVDRTAFLRVLSRIKRTSAVRSQVESIIENVAVSAAVFPSRFQLCRNITCEIRSSSRTKCATLASKVI